jgi:hypothetical protein
MKIKFWPVFLLLLPSFLVGCTVNNARLLPTGGSVDSGRAIVVYGVQVEGDWAYPAFAVQLDEYSLKTQSATGDCLRFNRMEARVPSTPGPVRYVAFDVRPGAYVISPFTGAPRAGGSRLDTTAFLAPEGRIVYAGDFVYARNRTLEYRSDVGVLRKALANALPDLKGAVAPADTVTVQAAKPFLCTP